MQLVKPGPGYYRDIRSMIVVKPRALAAIAGLKGLPKLVVFAEQIRGEVVLLNK